MKKLTVLFTMAFLLFSASMISFGAEEHEDGLIDLYPYDQQGCMTTTETCTRTRVGSANWFFEYYGHRYHVVRGSARYVVDFEDTNADGYIDALEMTSTEWNAFASVIINDTDEGVILSTNNARTDLTQVVHRMYAYFDEDGTLQMFEDHIQLYYIYNDGDATDPAWRLATQAEIDAFEAADDPVVDTPNTLHTHIRIALDDSVPHGHVVEPLGYLSWYRPGVDKVEDPIEDWSLIVDGDPEQVSIPAGWTVVSFGTLDRDNTNAKATQYIHSLPQSMVDDTVEAFELTYVDQPASFDGIAALDDDAGTPGVNIVVDYNGTFDFDADAVSASWLNMFDENGNIINETEMLDYKIEISQDGTVLQTIDFTYDESTDSYTASEALTVVDSSEFGAGYIATFIAETPLGDVTESEVDIVIGVMPPKFVGVDDRYINEGSYINVLAGITADDGYGNDLTNTIEVTYPQNFNTYSPKPGVYTIGLEFTHNVFFAGDEYELIIGGTDVNWDGADALNTSTAINAYIRPQVWTDDELFRTIGSGWGSVMIVVNADGEMIERWDRYNWEYTTSTGTVVGDAGQFAAWQAALTLAEGEFVVGAHGGTETPPLRAANLSYGDSVDLTIGTEDFSYDIVTTTTFDVTVDDITAPYAMVVNPSYTITIGQFSNVNTAILSNVVAYDNYDSPSQIALYVSNNGGLNLSTAGTYTVEVTAEDRAGNTATATYDLTVVAPAVTEDDVNAKPNNEDVEEMINERLVTEARIQELIDAAVQDALENDLPEDETGASYAAVIITSIVTAGAAFAGAVVLMIKKPF